GGKDEPKIAATGRLAQLTSARPICSHNRRFGQRWWRGPASYIPRTRTKQVATLSDLSLFFRKLRQVDGTNALGDGRSRDVPVAASASRCPPRAEVVSSNLAGRAICVQNHELGPP